MTAGPLSYRAHCNLDLAKQKSGRQVAICLVLRISVINPSVWELLPTMGGSLRLGEGAGGWSFLSRAVLINIQMQIMA